MEVAKEEPAKEEDVNVEPKEIQLTPVVPKVETINGEERAEAPKEDASPEITEKTEPTTSTPPAAAETADEDEKMDIEEPIKVEKVPSPPAEEPIKTEKDAPLSPSKNVDEKAALIPPAPPVENVPKEPAPILPPNAASPGLVPPPPPPNSFGPPVQQHPPNAFPPPPPPHAQHPYPAEHPPGDIRGPAPHGGLPPSHGAYPGYPATPQQYNMQYGHQAPHGAYPGYIPATQQPFYNAQYGHHNAPPQQPYYNTPQYWPVDNVRMPPQMPIHPEAPVPVAPEDKGNS